MKKILLIGIFFGFSSLAFSQNEWTPRASLPDSARAYSIGFSIGNYGYIGLGLYKFQVNYPCLDDFWQFDPSNNSWIQKANFPGKARISPATFVIGHYGYVVTGQTNDSSSPKYTQECWRYDANTNTWEQKANFPGTARAYDVGFAISGKGYVGTGSDYYNYYYKDFWEYDTTTDTWTQKASFGGIARIASNGFASNGNGYICFGSDSTGKLYKDVWEYNVGTNTWAQKSNYPGYPMYGGSGFVIGANIYVGTGEGSVLLNEFWQYNTLLDTWTQQEDFPGPSRAVTCGFAIADTGYLGMGLDSNLTFFNSIYKFLLDTALGIVTVKNANPIYIYPNPFSVSCNISVLNNGRDPEFALYNINGEKESAAVSYNYPNYVLNRGRLSAGVYILSIKCSNKVFYNKLIITN